MKTRYLIIAGLIASFTTGYCFNKVLAQKQTTLSTEIAKTERQGNMSLGAFSMSLSVRDLKTSKEFYEALGFYTFAGSMKQNYLIMKNNNALIGLFQGMFQGNILTFNPGWDENATNIQNFKDIREIQSHLKNKGITLTTEADEKANGPASLTLTDPDGNVILLDQHR